MHKLERNIFLGKKNALLRTFAETCDDIARRSLRKRISERKISLPYILKITWAYYTLKSSLSIRGWKGSIRKVIFKLQSLIVKNNLLI